MSLLKKIYRGRTGYHYFLMMGLISCLSVNAMAGDCDTTSVTYGNLQIDRSETSRGCTLNLHPSVEPKAFRSVEFDERGALQISDRYDGSTSKSSTGTRTYFVFPRKQVPTFVPPTSADASSDSPLLPAQVITASGDPIFFLPGRRSNGGIDDGSLPQITSSDNPNFQLIEDPEVTVENKGGVDVSLNEHAQVLVLDCGFRKGGSACNVPNGNSTFMDRAGLDCTLPNKDLFKYVNSEAQLKWKDDTSLFAYLKKACPDLSLPTRAIAKQSKTPPNAPQSNTRLPAQAKAASGKSIQ